MTSIHIISRFIDKVKEDIQGHGVKELLQILCNVYALSLVHKHLGDFISTGYITPKQGALANEQLRFLYAQVFVVYLYILELFSIAFLSSFPPLCGLINETYPD